MLDTLLLLATLHAATAAPGPLSSLGPIPAGVVRVLFVRHGQAYSNLNPKPKLSREELDRLTALGQAQARRAAEVLREQGISEVVTSPAGRAKETAEILRAALWTPPVSVDTRVRPLELGRSPSGQALGWDEREAEWKAGRDPAPEGGESLRQLADRLLDLVASMATARPGRAVVVVTHGEAIAALVGLLKAEPTGDWEEFGVQNASVTVVEASAGKPAKLGLVNVSTQEAKP